MKNFDAQTTLSTAKSEEIRDWAIAKLEKMLAACIEDTSKRFAAWTDEEIKAALGKRDQKKLEDGKLTIEDARRLLKFKDCKGDIADNEKAIEAIKAAFSKELPKTIRIDVEWTRSRTWGFNPKAEVWAGDYSSSRSIGGCGFDKESMATARAFENNPVFARIAATCAWLDEKETEATGTPSSTYGYYASYSGFRFEGGVGFSCHQHIIERAGYRLVAEFHPKGADGYKFEKI